MGRLVGYDTQRNNHGGKRNSSPQLTYRIQLAMVSRETVKELKQPLLSKHEGLCWTPCLSVKPGVCLVAHARSPPRPFLEVLARALCPSSLAKRPPPPASRANQRVSLRAAGSRRRSQP